MSRTLKDDPVGNPPISKQDYVGVSEDKEIKKRIHRLEEQEESSTSEEEDENLATLSSSDGSDSCQRLVRESRHWSAVELNKVIQDILIDVKEYSLEHSLGLKSAGKSEEYYIFDSLRKVQKLTSRLASRAYKLENQVLHLKKDNDELRERLVSVESDIASVKRSLQMHISEDDEFCLKIPAKDKRSLSTPMEEESGIVAESSMVRQDIHQDSTTLVPTKNKVDTELVDYIVDKMDIFMSTVIEKVQPLVAAEVKRACAQMIRLEQSDSMEPPVAEKVVYSHKREGVNTRRSSDPAPSNLDLNLDLDNMRLFPPLSKRRISSDTVTNTSTPRKGKPVRRTPSRAKAESVEDVNRSARLKRHKEETILIQIADDSKISFSVILADLKNSINLKSDIGIDALRMRRTSKGGGIFLIADKDATQKANLLAECMTNVLSKYEGKVKVIRPRRNAMVIISGRDDFISADEVAAAVMNSGCCKREDIRVGKIIRKSFGRWSTLVTCPASICEIICKVGKLQTGWGWAGVRLAPPPATRCYRCLKTGHARASCKETDDRSFRCFKCGDMSHKALECNSKSFKCPLCMDVNKDCSNHRLGDSGCVCPSFFVNQTTTTFTSDSSRTTEKDNSLSEFREAKFGR